MSPSGFIRHRVIENPIGFAGFVEWQDVGVGKLGGNLDLSEEAFTAQAGGDLGPEHLQDDKTVVLLVRGEVDNCHPTPPEFTLKGIPI